MGIFGKSAPIAQPAGLMPQQDIAPIQDKPSFFGNGGAGRDIAGRIGDWLAQVNGVAPVYGPAMQEQRQMAYQNAMMQRRQAMQMANWQQQYDYKAAHPAPAKDTSLITNYNWLVQNGHPELAQQLITNAATAPPIVQHNADGTSTLYPSGAIPQGSAPTAPVGKLTPITDGVMTADQAGPVMGEAVRTNMISAADAAKVRQSLGPNGQAAFENWMRSNNITIGN